MPAGISFGARTTRDNNYVGVPKDTKHAAEHLGPGTHLHDGVTSSFARVRPSFAAFGATAERSFRGFSEGGAGGAGGDDVPGPGMYLSDATMSRASHSEAGIGIGVFRSATSRSGGGASSEAGATSPRRQPAHYEKTPGPGA